MDPPKGVIQLIHGFGEHSRRYLHMIGMFQEAGYAVIADDHIGHGKTATIPALWATPAPPVSTATLPI